jgi:hypothetical protein
MPSKKQILDFWIEKLINTKYWLDVYFDDIKEAHNICFACGSSVGSERCHIEPLYKNKTNENVNSCSNIHLLCKECHLESESFSGDLYNYWFMSKTPSNSGSQLRILNKTNTLINYCKEYNIDINEILPNANN